MNPHQNRPRNPRARTSEPAPRLGHLPASRSILLPYTLSTAGRQHRGPRARSVVHPTRPSRRLLRVRRRRHLVHPGRVCNDNGIAIVFMVWWLIVRAVRACLLAASGSPCPAPGVSCICGSLLSTASRFPKTRCRHVLATPVRVVQHAAAININDITIAPGTLPNCVGPSCTSLTGLGSQYNTSACAAGNSGAKCKVTCAAGFSGNPADYTCTGMDFFANTA